MGTFNTAVRIANVVDRQQAFDLSSVMVDTGSEYTWVPAGLLEQIAIAREKKDLQFTMANGQQVTRAVGFAVVSAGGSFTVDEVVFAQPGDLMLLGARSLEGLNLMVDPARKRLVAAGPLPAAVAENS